MKRTRYPVILLLLVIGVGSGLLVQQVLGASGRPAITPPLTLDLVLGTIGVVLVVLAVPVRRAVKATDGRRVDPFYALRVVVLAKSCALTGAVLAGVGIGFAVYLLTRTVPALGSVGYSIGMAAGAVILLVAGLIAEEMCRIPPSDEEPDDEAVAAL